MKDQTIRFKMPSSSHSFEDDIERCEIPGFSSRYQRYYSHSRTDDDEKKHQEKRKFQWKTLFQPLFGSKRLGWTKIPLGLGIFYLCILQLYRRFERETEIHRKDDVLSSTFVSPDDIIVEREPWQVTFLRKLPLRTMSRVWGVLTHIDLPIFMRGFIYRTWAHFFDTDLSEAEEDDLTIYKNLAEFFVRRLKSGIRPIDENALVVSPADGRILHFGAVTDGWLEQVKGVPYRLESFFGYQHLLEPEDALHTHDSFLALNLKDGKPIRVENQLFYCVIYLGPGDYHRFHSPTNWNVYSRRHFPGDLLSVAPGFLKLIRGVFVYNERVAMLGEWPHGFFSMTAVGATNVGSIRVHFDEDLKTNLPHVNRPQDHRFQRQKKNEHNSSSSPITKNDLQDSYSKEEDNTLMPLFISKDYTKSHSGHPIHLLKGIEVGAFHLGSSIVLVFEAPSTFEFGIKQNQKIRLGAALGDIRTSVVPIDGSNLTPELSGKETPIKVVSVSGTSLADTTTLPR